VTLLTDNDGARPSPIADSAQNTDASLNVRAIVFMVLAAAAPMTAVAGLFPIVITTSRGTAIPLLFIVAGALLLIFSVGFTEMSRRVSNPGAFYTYIQAGMGRVVGSGGATLAVFVYLLFVTSATVYTGTILSGLLERFFGHTFLPWWAWALVLIAAIGSLGYREISISAKVLAALLILETAVVVVVDIAIVVQGGRDGLNMAPFSPTALGEAPALGAMFAFLAFVGFEATAIYRNEAINPRVTIPRATYLAVVLVGGLYIFSGWAVVMGLGDDALARAQADPATVVSVLAQEFVAPVIGDIVQILFFTSFFAACLAFHNVLARYQRVVGQSGLMPEIVARLHPRHRVPSNASLALTTVSFILVVLAAISGLDPVTEIFTWFQGAATLGLVFLMALTSVAVVVFFRRHHEYGLGWRTFVAPSLAALGLSALVAMVSLNFDLLVPQSTAAAVIQCVVVAAFLTGVVTALVIKWRAPQRYARLCAAADAVD
jgi:amino acid transporter